MRRAVFFVAVCAALSRCAQQPPENPGIELVQIGQERYALEVAADPMTREQGFMRREKIDPGTGMLFVFPGPGVLDFWMGNCLVDIDIIFLDPRGRVTATHRMKAQPPRAPEESEQAYRARLGTYTSGLPAQFAIELPAGSLDRLRVGVEDKIELDLERLKALAAATDLP